MVEKEQDLGQKSAPIVRMYLMIKSSLSYLTLSTEPKILDVARASNEAQGQDPMSKSRAARALFRPSK